MENQATKTVRSWMSRTAAVLGAWIAIGQPGVAHAGLLFTGLGCGKFQKPAVLCNRTGSKTFGVGSTGTARGEFTAAGSIYANTCWQSATLDGTIRGCFIGQCANLAHAGVQEYSGGGSRALVEIASLTVFSQSIYGAGSATMTPMELKVGLGGTIPIVPGIVDASVEAEFGAGASMGVGYDVYPVPPIAKADGEAKAYGYGSGSVGVKVLGGIAGSASCKGTLSLPSPNLTAALDAGVCTPNGAALSASIAPWTLDARLNWKVGCIPWVGCAYRGSEKLITASGSASDYSLL